MTLDTPADREQLASRGIAPQEADDQLRRLRAAPPAMVLDRPCTLGDGIIRLTDQEHSALAAAADAAIGAGRVMKFVPASGAATRMFKDLIAALANDAQRPSQSDAGSVFFSEFDRLPFAAQVRDQAGLTGAIATADDERRILRTLLEGLRYAELPKALIPFHGGPVVRTPFEEHLLEAVEYCADADGVIRVHFTVPPEFRADFERLLTEITPRVEAIRPGLRLRVTFSEQHPSTDTLAATPEGEVFRTAEGSLLFRPAGHGALLRNLQGLDGDLVVIKNIDNVPPHAASATVVEWKRLLIGLVATLQAGICDLLAACGPGATDDALDRAIEAAHQRFGHLPAAPLRTADDKRAFVAAALERPLRVCGVVKNEGEPGGAPFWIVEPGGERSRQIVEASQVDLSDAGQRQIFESSTHFNPVDIVCAVRGCDGTPHDLAAFVDPEAVFLSQKSHEGRDLIALERPGLWNGAMAHWNTVFVEVPAATFAPVKTVLDLLRPQHQSL